MALLLALSANIGVGKIHGLKLQANLCGMARSAPGRRGSCDFSARDEAEAARSRQCFRTRQGRFYPSVEYDVCSQKVRIFGVADDATYRIIGR